MAGRWRPPPNAPGAHFLTAGPAADIVRRAGLGPDDLVLDLGAGLGALTAPLAATGARVIAVEINSGYARSLAHRFAASANVRVVGADLRTVTLPRRAFRVVANLPFDTTTALLRRLLDPVASALVRADLVVEYGLARRVCTANAGTVWWAARYDIRLVRPLPAGCFRPPPAVDAALLSICRVTLPPEAERALHGWLRAASAVPHRPVRALLRGEIGAAGLRAAGVQPGQPAGTVAARQWRALAVMR